MGSEMCIRDRSRAKIESLCDAVLGPAERPKGIQVVVDGRHVVVVLFDAGGHVRRSVVALLVCGVTSVTTARGRVRAVAAGAAVLVSYASW